MNHRLLMAFVDQSPSFAYGFEAGKVWAEMGSNRRVIEGQYHEENHEQLMRCAQTKGYHVISITGQGSGWVLLKFRKPFKAWVKSYLENGSIE